MAPVIENLPSPVVGNVEPVSDNGRFVFPDALDLNNYALDDATPAGQLIWTYYQAPGGHYLINGVAPIDPAKTNITSPTTSQIINRTVKKPEYDPDGYASTITIRNQYLSPLGTGQTIDEGWAEGIIPAESQLVTFFCSDGTSYSSRTVVFYTSNNDYDRLSPTGYIPHQDPMRYWKKETWTAGVTSSTWDGGSSGLCLIAPLRGLNFAEYASPAPYFQLTKNTVYRIKLQMNSTQAAPGKIPLWDLVLENTNFTGTFGMMAYMMDTIFYDDPFNGGANSVINTRSGDWKTIYWSPAPVAAPQWDKVFSSKYDTMNDPRLRFRILDVDGVGQGEMKSGAICIQSIQLDSIPISRIRTVKNLVHIAAGGVRAANAAGTGNLEVQSLVDARHIAVTYANGAVTVRPTSAEVPHSYIDAFGQTITSTGQQFEYTEIHPAATSDGFADSLDNWPLTWDASMIYRLQVGLSAPSPWDAAHPWDAVFLSMYSRTYELFADTYITSRDLLGSPAYTVGSDGKIVPQTYQMFFQGGKGSKALPQNARLRWAVRFANSPRVSYPSNSMTVDPLNMGAVTLHSVSVDEVEFTY